MPFVFYSPMISFSLEEHRDGRGLPGICWGLSRDPSLDQSEVSIVVRILTVWTNERRVLT